MLIEDTSNGKEIVFDYKRHHFSVGSLNQGKKEFLYHLIFEASKSNRRIIVIDPNKTITETNFDSKKGLRILFLLIL